MVGEVLAECHVDYAAYASHTIYANVTATFSDAISIRGL